MEIIQRFKSLTKSLFVQLELYGQLAKVEWAEEKYRLQKLVLATLLGTIFAIAFLLSVTTLIIVLTWATDYRILAIVIVVATYGLGAFLCAYHAYKLVLQGRSAFSATQEEMLIDLALIKSQL